MPNSLKKFNNIDARLILLIPVLLIYGQTILFHFNIDDFLVLNDTAGKIDTLQDLFSLFTKPFNQVDYRPVSLFSFGLENLLLGKITPGISHLVNLVLFYLVGIIAWKLLTKLTKGGYPGEVLLITLLFLCSPVNTEVVSSIKSRDNLLSLFFSLISLYLMIHDYQRKNILQTCLGLFFFFLATLAKRDSIGILAFLPFCLVYHTEMPRKKKWITVVSVITMLALLFQLRNILAFSFIPESAPGVSSTGSVTFTENPLSEIKTYGVPVLALFQSNLIYLGKLLFPFDLRFYYGFDYCTLRTSLDLRSVVVILFQLLLFSGILYIGRKYIWILTGLAGYAFFILYALNFYTPVAGIVADRYAFQAGIWFWLCILFVFKALFGYTSHPNGWKILIIGMIITYTGIAVYRTSAWKDKLTLLDRDMPHLERSFEAQRIAASSYMEYWQDTSYAGNKEVLLLKALGHAQTANRIYPFNPVTHRLEGIIQFHLGNYTQAKTQFDQAYQIDTTSAEILEMLGDIYYIEKNYLAAKKVFDAAFQLDPGSNVLANKISTVLYESGQRDSCLRYNLQLIESHPSMWAPYENLGYYYLDGGDTLRASEYFRQARLKGLTDPAPL